MIAYIVRRLFATMPVMAVVAVFVFFLLHLAPGDPAAIIAGDHATSDADRRRAQPSSASTGRSGAVRRLGLARCCRAISASRSSPTCRSRTLIAQRVEPTLVARARHADRRGVARGSARRARGLEGAHAGRPRW